MLESEENIYIVDINLVKNVNAIFFLNSAISYDETCTITLRKGCKKPSTVLFLF